MTMRSVQDLLTRFSPEARKRRAAIETEVRALLIEIQDLDLREMRRLSRDTEATAAIELNRQKLENCDFNEAMSVGVVVLLFERAGPRSTEGYLPDALNVLEETRNKLRLLLLEYVQISGRELRRLALESSGADRWSLESAAALLEVARQQLETGQYDLFEKAAGDLKEAASSEIECRARSN